MSKIYTAADQLIGHTPLLELTHIEKEQQLPAHIIAKLEYFNPAGSVKDRIAKKMIDDAEDDLHTIPFFGSIDWNAVMHALYEIGYDGALNYEVAIMKRLPDELKDYAAKLMYETGKYLIGLAK